MRATFSGVKESLACTNGASARFLILARRELARSAFGKNEDKNYI